MGSGLAAEPVLGPREARTGGPHPGMTDLFVQSPLGPRASGPHAPTLPSPAGGGGLGRGRPGRKRSQGERRDVLDLMLAR
jgi:hypothetical protein